jgi:hypothetical protein
MIPVHKIATSSHGMIGLFRRNGLNIKIIKVCKATIYTKKKHKALGKLGKLKSVAWFTEKEQRKVPKKICK